MSSDKIKDGGPAFPVSYQIEGATYTCLGMSVRAYAAIHAPEPPAWWFNSKECQALTGGYVRNMAWRLSWAQAMVDALEPE